MAKPKLSRAEKIALRKKKEKAGPTPTSTKKLEASYRKEMDDLTKSLDEELKLRLLPLLLSDVEGSVIQAVLIAITEEFRNKGDMLSIELAQRMVNDAATRSFNAFNQASYELPVVIGPVYSTPAVMPIVEKSINTNVSLIRSIVPQHMEHITKGVMKSLEKHYENEMRAAVSESFSVESKQTSLEDDVFKVLAKAGNASRNRARVIARDQTTKVVSDVAAARAQEIGITEYIWSTSGDDRVRDGKIVTTGNGNHAALNGKRFTYEKGVPNKNKYASMKDLTVLNPGKDIMCRCIAIPVIPPRS